jgi:Holliday junction resolvase RusA-like endonuclease
LLDLAKRQNAAPLNGTEPVEGPVNLLVSAHYLFSASWSKPKCARSGGWKTSRPDLDNIVKLYKGRLHRHRVAR